MTESECNDTPQLYLFESPFKDENEIMDDNTMPDIGVIVEICSDGIAQTGAVFRYYSSRKVLLPNASRFVNCIGSLTSTTDNGCYGCDLEFETRAAAIMIGNMLHDHDQNPRIQWIATFDERIASTYTEMQEKYYFSS